MLDDRIWVDELNQEHNLSGTTYYISSNDTGEPMYFFLFGMSYIYSIFFFIGHLFAGMLGYAQDGLSPPYQYALVYGCMIYTIIGLHYLRKILLTYFTEWITALTMILLVIGTNYTHHMTLKNLETVNVLFMFAVIIIWNTIRWYEEFKFRQLLAIGVSLVLMALCKPSEILFVFVPLIWGMSSGKDLWNRAKLLFRYKWHLLAVIIICFFIALPQALYWYSKTGHVFYDTYKNPGVGLDLGNPHILESLFSYRKGWLLYTPVMIFALPGLVILFKRNRKIFFGILIPFIISFYIIASWTEYWYGAGFSNRPVITLYSLLVIPLGYFLLWLSEQKKPFKVVTWSVLSILTLLNQFQWWQLRNHILDPYRTTKEYYWAVFLKTEVQPEDKKLMLVNRDFSGVQVLSNPEDYRTKKFIDERNLKMINDQDQPLEYTFEHNIPYESLTERDHCWIQYTFEYKIGDSSADILLCTMMNRENGSYAADYYKVEPNNNQEWQLFDRSYLTPEIRSTKDELKFFLWNRSGSPVEIRNFKAYIYEKP